MLNAVNTSKMEVKKSKIQKVEMLPEWSNDYGTYYPHKVTFENGDVAIANKKSKDAFTINQEIQYEIVGQDPAGNNKFKEVQDESYTPGFKKQGGNASFALSYAKDLGIAHINKGAEFGATEIIQVAEKFNKWLNEN